MGVTTTATTATSTPTTPGGAAAACIVGPKGPTDSRLSGLGARTVKPKGLTVLTAVLCVLMTAGLKAGRQLRATMWPLPVLKATSQQAGTIKACGMWPVTDSYLRIQTACLSSRRLDYMSGLGPTATSGHVKQRQRQRRRLHDSHCGVMCCQVWQKNLRRPACWSRRRRVQRPGLILILAGVSWWPVCHGLFRCTRPVWLRLGLAWLVWMT